MQYLLRLEAFIIVIIPLALTQSPPYGFNSLNIDVGSQSYQESQTVVPGETVHISWSFSSNPGYDSCYIAIRSFANPDLIVTDINPHPQCGASSADLVIPQTPINSSVLYNGTRVNVRINAAYGTYSDSVPFR